LCAATTSTSTAAQTIPSANDRKARGQFAEGQPDPQGSEWKFQIRDQRRAGCRDQAAADCQEEQTKPELGCPKEDEQAEIRTGNSRRVRPGENDEGEGKGGLLRRRVLYRLKP
jgi:hypothetical protein